MLFIGFCFTYSLKEKVINIKIILSFKKVDYLDLIKLKKKSIFSVILPNLNKIVLTVLFVKILRSREESKVAGFFVFLQ